VLKGEKEVLDREIKEELENEKQNRNRRSKRGGSRGCFCMGLWKRRRWISMSDVARHPSISMVVWWG